MFDYKEDPCAAVNSFLMVLHLFDHGKRDPMYTGSRLQRGRLQRAPDYIYIYIYIYNEQIYLHQNN